MTTVIIPSGIKTHINTEGREYLGDKNNTRLNNRMVEKMYHIPNWGTYQQWNSEGRFVRKGEKCLCLSGRDDKDTKWTFYVFNIQQTDEKKVLNR
jgi:antirestriction protein ArdC